MKNLNKTDHNEEIEKKHRLKKSELLNELVGMGKKGYKISEILKRKKEFEKEKKLQIDFSENDMEDIVSSILFYTVYYTGDIEGMLSELEEIKETLTKSSIPFEATHHTKSLISHGIREYRRHSNNPNSNDRLFEDIKKLKLHELYVDNAKQEITRSATKQLEYELSTGPSLGEEKEE